MFKIARERAERFEFKKKSVSSAFLFPAWANGLAHAQKNAQLTCFRVFGQEVCVWGAVQRAALFNTSHFIQSQIDLKT